MQQVFAVILSKQAVFNKRETVVSTYDLLFARTAKAAREFYKMGISGKGKWADRVQPIVCKPLACIGCTCQPTVDKIYKVSKCSSM